MPNIGDFTKVNTGIVEPKPLPPGAAALQDFMTTHNLVPPQTVSPEQVTSDQVMPTPQEEAVPVIPGQVTEADFERALAQAAKSPEATYEERLKAFDLTREQAASIVDSLLTKGFYEKVYPVTSKIGVTFRTRKVEDNDQLFTDLERQHPEYGISISNQITKANLASSLAAVGTKKFAPNKAGRDAAAACILNLPAHVFALLADKLANFDRMVTTVLDAGVIENF
jgi:hypothetical protein